ncbi:hypothetical protein GWI33_005646 [Rhynchophorus ferrugineus]|uniref:Uncharacterized protein n=1 Tax=Rhynchophorus ferrugineus TaxID=354439 RepID=A0A834MFX2_RHYFE|nr:hypothetical protein GWI33_005646 [Rhynchophorus ferrugineus]
MSLFSSLRLQLEQSMDQLVLMVSTSRSCSFEIPQSSTENVKDAKVDWHHASNCSTSSNYVYIRYGHGKRHSVQILPYNSFSFVFHLLGPPPPPPRPRRLATVFSDTNPPSPAPETPLPLRRPHPLPRKIYQSALDDIRRV